MTPTGLARLLKEDRGSEVGIVPVVGAGVNIEASAIEHRGPADDWAGLLDRIAVDTGLTKRERSALPASFLARWETLLLRWAEIHGVAPHKAENQLQTRVVTGLRALEEDADSFALYREFAASGLVDLISLNFDRRIALASAREKFDTGPKNPPEGPSARPLYRHSRIETDGGIATRVWYPHGDTKRADTLKLGVRRYGFHLGLLQEYLGHFGDEWRTNVAWMDRMSEYSYPWRSEPGDDEVTSWVDVFLSRPLLFIGCGMGADEWSLWWLLRVRADAGADTQPAYFSYVGDCDVTVRVLGPTLGLRPIEFDSYPQLWATIRGAIS